MSVTVVDDDIVQARRFKSMHGTDSCWNCDRDYALHNDGYYPDMDEDFANCPHPSAALRKGGGFQRCMNVQNSVARIVSRIPASFVLRVGPAKAGGNMKKRTRAIVTLSAPSAATCLPKPSLSGFHFAKTAAKRKTTCHRRSHDRRVTMPALKQLTCLRCGYQWWPKSPEKPRTCANKKCNSPYWSKPRGGKQGRPKKDRGVKCFTVKPLLLILFLAFSAQAQRLEEIKDWKLIKEMSGEIQDHSGLTIEVYAAQIARRDDGVKLIVKAEFPGGAPYDLLKANVPHGFDPSSISQMIFRVDLNCDSLLVKTANNSGEIYQFNGKRHKSREIPFKVSAGNVFAQYFCEQGPRINSTLKRTLSIPTLKPRLGNPKLGG